MHFWIFHAYVGVFCAFEHFWFTVLGTLLRESQRVSPKSRPSLYIETRVRRPCDEKNITAPKNTFRVIRKHRQMP